MEEGPVGVHGGLAGGWVAVHLTHQAGAVGLQGVTHLAERFKGRAGIARGAPGREDAIALDDDGHATRARARRGLRRSCCSDEACGRDGGAPRESEESTREVAQDHWWAPRRRVTRIVAAPARSKSPAMESGRVSEAPV